MSIERRTELSRAYNDGYANGYDDGVKDVFVELDCLDSFDELQEFIAHYWKTCELRRWGE